MIRLCLFDLDQTLVDTSDMQQLRESGVHRDAAGYPLEVQAAFRSRERRIVDEQTLLALALSNPEMKLGIFTRSPRRYVDVILATAYNLVKWDVVIAYEDVQHRKPNCEGIYKAMIDVGMNDTKYIPEVMLVGDSDVDIRAAYHAGCQTVLFKGGWPPAYEKTHWRSLGLLPDAIVADQSKLGGAAVNVTPLLPDLECLLSDAAQAPVKPRFDEIGKFFPNDRTRHVVHAAGRSFAGYESLKERRQWHALSQSIQDNKESVIFPVEWIESVKRFIAQHYMMMAAIAFGGGVELVITAIPARPGRVHRLAHFLNQLRASYGADPCHKNLRLTFDPDMLAYKEGVRSQSREHLNPEDRFVNVRDHLVVAKPEEARRKRFLVIDDVSTTGATLLYAQKYLTEAGATSVDCFTIAMNISDPLR